VKQPDSGRNLVPVQFSMRALSNTLALLLLILLNFSLVNMAQAQAHRSMVQQADTVRVQADSITSTADSTFKSIRDRVDKNFFTRTLGDLVLVPDDRRRRSRSASMDTVDFRTSVEYFMPYAGKRLSQIRFKQVDVLAASVWDTSLVSGSFVSNILNSLHTKTRDQVVADILLFQPGDTLQPNDLADTERILRMLPSIEDAKIYVSPAARDSDAVDLLIVTQDRFSWGIGMTVLAADRYRLRLINRNVLGWGAELNYAMLYDRQAHPLLAHDFRYNVYNIRGSFISSVFNYIYSQKSQSLWLSFSRPFISPHLSYIGSLDLGSARNLMTFNDDGISTSEYVRVFNQDFWIGRIFTLGRIQQRNNLILSGRLSRTRFSERPDIEGVNTYLYNNTLILGRLSLAQIRYFKSRMIYSFGRTEDVPYGLLIQGTLGYEVGELENRYYFGSDFSWANTLDNLGYLGLSTEFGIFRHSKDFNQGVLNLQLLYFSPLLEFHRFNIRQIIKMSFTNGINRTPLETINLKHKLKGFSKDEPAGKGILIVNLETVTFAPWYFYGFKFALFTYADFALLSERSVFTSRTELYSTVGLGCRLKNESLVFKTLNLRIGYFFHNPLGLGPWGFEITDEDSEISQGLLGLKPAVVQYK
jgi:hypothetical protein